MIAANDCAIPNSARMSSVAGLDAVAPLVGPVELPSALMWGRKSGSPALPRVAIRITYGLRCRADAVVRFEETRSGHGPWTRQIFVLSCGAPIDNVREAGEDITAVRGSRAERSTAVSPRLIAWW